MTTTLAIRYAEHNKKNSLASAYSPTPQRLWHALANVLSGSKGITAEVVACLVNEGQLNWNDNLATLLPPGTPLSADAQKITLLELVTHTSGLPRQNMDVPMLGKFITYLSTGDNFYGELDSDNVLRYLADWRAPENKVPQYSNTGYALIGYLLKHKTGEDIQSLASRYIFRPLQMANSSFTPQQLKGYPQRALGHAGDQPKFIPRGQLTPDWHFSNNMVAAASLYSNAEDLAAYARYHVSTTHNPLLDSVFAEVRNTDIQRPDGVQALSAMTKKKAMRWWCCKIPLTGVITLASRC
ncbi:hypothetical protein L1887_45770 [Cichorium endivia]|nr:hypothetical protein L1887_45770 [Cichorium endivia]